MIQWEKSFSAKEWTQLSSLVHSLGDLIVKWPGFLKRLLSILQAIKDGYEIEIIKPGRSVEEVVVGCKVEADKGEVIDIYGDPASDIFYLHVKTNEGESVLKSFNTSSGLINGIFCERQICTILKIGEYFAVGSTSKRVIKILDKNKKIVWTKQGKVRLIGDVSEAFCKPAILISNLHNNQDGDKELRVIDIETRQELYRCDTTSVSNCFPPLECIGTQEYGVFLTQRYDDQVFLYYFDFLSSSFHSLEDYSGQPMFQVVDKGTKFISVVDEKMQIFKTENGCIKNQEHLIIADNKIIAFCFHGGALPEIYFADQEGILKIYDLVSKRVIKTIYTGDCDIKDIRTSASNSDFIIINSKGFSKYKVSIIK